MITAHSSNNGKKEPIFEIREVQNANLEVIPTDITANERSISKNASGLGPKPFLKWVGGKRSILPILLERLPKEYNRYCEPFIGGGALFFAVQPKNAYLSDINLHLIVTYAAVKDDLSELISLLKSHKESHSRKHFAAARDLLFNEKEQTKIAALMIYLNKTCYNGLYRVNKSGRFNVPIGSYTDPAIFDEEVLKIASDTLKSAELQHHPFHQIPVEEGDFYYLDPPYHQTYSSYDGAGFGDSEHSELADKCRQLDTAGAYFMLSNSDTEFIRNLYRGFKIEKVSASRTVSCKPSQRGKEDELIIRNYPR